jgi:hypothetical protein
LARDSAHILDEKGPENRAMLRIIFVRDRRAEQREDTVTGGLQDVAVVAMDRRS